MDVEPTSLIDVFLDRIAESNGDPDTLFTRIGFSYINRSSLTSRIYPTTDEQLEIVLEDLIIGSLQSAGTILCWSILLMVLNDDVQEKVRRVIEDETKRDGNLTAMQLKRLALRVSLNSLSYVFLFTEYLM